MALQLSALATPSPHLSGRSSNLLTFSPSHHRPITPQAPRLRSAPARPCPSCSASESGPASSSPYGSVPESGFYTNNGSAYSASSESPRTSPASGFYTSMKDDHLRFWDTHEPIQSSVERGRTPEAEDQMLVAELRLLATAAADRAEMHSILAQQRDNWNTLFQKTLTMATMTATVLAGLDGQHHSLSLSIPAFFLDAGCACMMAVINQFEPSQLAEEQRTATRLSRKLVSDIDYELSVSPTLRQDTVQFLKDSQHKLHCLDRAFPMPLTPGGLDKFPTAVVPPVLSDGPINNSALAETAPGETNGWTESVTRDLSEVARLLEDSDVKTYVGWAQNLVKVNKGLAVAAPLFALCGAALNAVDSLGWSAEMGVYAAVCSVLAAFAGSFSHDMQLGMIFELYRNSAGYYGELEANINKTLQTPVKQREHGVLFRRRVSYALGRDEEEGLPVVPRGSKTGGTLF